MKNRNETGFLDPFISGSITPSLKLMASQETPSLYGYHAWQAIACVAIVDHCFRLNTNNLLNQGLRCLAMRAGQDGAVHVQRGSCRN